MMNAPGPSAAWTATRFYQNPLQMFETAQGRYGDLVRFEVLGYRLFQVTSPEACQHIMTSPHYTLSGSLDSAAPFVGHGLATNTGESWVTQRRLMQPTFHHKMLIPLVESMVTEIDSLLGTWSGTFDVVPPLLRINHHILAHVILGDSNQPRLIEALGEIRLYLNRRFHALLPMPSTWPTPRNRRYARAVADFNQVVEAHMEAADDEHTMLALLKKAVDPKTGQGMSFAQLHDEINTLFFNAYDDPGSTLAWTMWLLSQNPQVEATLREEIETVLGPRRPTFEDLAQLPYTRRVIDEVLRLYPPTWSIMRDALQDDTLGDAAIPQGSTMLINLYLLHRHPQYWENPTQFNPDRFLSKPSEDRYLPFGMGSRRCIGQQFALLEIQLCLIRLIQHGCWEVITQGPIALEAISSLKPLGGLKVRWLPTSPPPTGLPIK